MEYEITKSSSGVAESTNKCEIMLKSASVMDDPGEETEAMLRSVATGSVVYTAGMSFMAMKDPDGVWKEIGGEGEWTF